MLHTPQLSVNMNTEIKQKEFFMLTVKIIKDELQKQNISATLKVIGEFLTANDIEVSNLEDNQLGEVVNLFITEMQKKEGSQLAVSSPAAPGKPSKVTLSLRQELYTKPQELQTQDRSKERQQNHTNQLSDKMLDTAHAIADRNVEMVENLPILTEALTIQKLQEKAPDIQRSWNNVIDRLSDVMFGV